MSTFSVLQNYDDGISIKKVLPFPKSLSTPIRAFCASMNSFEIVNPSPVPADDPGI